jgi:hypothetical protein
MGFEVRDLGCWARAWRGVRVEVRVRMTAKTKATAKAERSFFEGFCAFALLRAE